MQEASVLDAQAMGQAVDRVMVASPDPSHSQAVREALSRARLGAAVKAVGVCQVSDHLSALGALATQGVADVVLVHVGALDDPLNAAAAATRQIAPDSRLILIAPADTTLKTLDVLAAGFDDLLVEPLDSGQLIRTLERHLGGGAPPERDAATPAAPRSDHAASVELGDVDLIEQLLVHGGQIRDMALTILRKQSGIENLGWCKSERDLPPGATEAGAQSPPTQPGGVHFARVEFTGSTFGLLHAPRSVPAPTLQSLAGWLARWLSLEQRMDQLWDMALRDELTGIWNRRYFERFLRTVLQRATDQRFRVTLMVFDIDDFKLYNDRYGHAAGDEILRESARLMLSVVRDHDVVARIGGDEFAVIFWDSEGPRKPGSDHPTDVTQAARRFQKAICEHKFPKLLNEAPGNLTISGGLASFPWDGRTPEELLAKADEMSLQSKRQGKNAITFGPGAARVCNTIHT